jgi:hypothetical protein
LRESNVYDATYFRFAKEAQPDEYGITAEFRYDYEVFGHGEIAIRIIPSCQANAYLQNAVEGPFDSASGIH